MRVASDIGWDFPSRSSYTSSLRSGIEFKPKKNLLSAVLDAQTVIVANDLQSDIRSGGLPPGHPPVKSFISMPLYLDDIVIGSIGLANRPHGYNDSVVKLEPISKLVGKCLIRFFMFSEEQLRKTVSKAQELKQKSAAEIRYRSMLEGKN
eukprot:TRINITY_DN2757_c0_g1_i10.p1 TRINITY_DN2757_c0_g1~~TRINITY_DN2757_c0_g1_i10.p1  ORF type:complete len:150 (+),score=32.57 TRINITY_DN2757_c0_g1_i10:370-819(+)